MITADALMVIAGLVLVKRVRGEVQHTIVQTLIAQNQLVRLRLSLRSLTLCLRHKHIIVQITLIHGPQVYKTEHQDNTHGILLLQFAEYNSQQHTCTHQNNIERTHGISRKHGLTHLCQISHQRLDILSRQTLDGTQLARRDKAVEEHRRHHRKQQGNTTRQQEANANILHSWLQQLGLVHQLLQRQHGEQGYRKLCDDEYRRHRTELGVHRHIVEEEIRKAHEVLTPRQEYRQNGSC